MVRSKFNSDQGSILLEFITFILFGQLLVFGAGMTILGELDQKLRLELFANQLARAQALGKLDVLSLALKSDYQLSQVELSQVPCAQALVCLEVAANSKIALGVSLATV